MVKETTKGYATFEHETVQAIVHSLFRFPSAMQAQLFASRFADQVIVSLRRPGGSDRKSIVLWVQGFGITQVQQKQGYLGHYAKISPRELPDGKWTLVIKKLDTPLAKHPLKAIPPHKPGKKIPAKKPAATPTKKRRTKK